ncbi:hypothetical protein [uncultured Chryseobacterium sp.]|uniref:hypothetical protein n=1 Tax=uncultured Chryseobacterium sp. TaxID=259322 RepID=UPI0025F3281A|nr:hypothetical protein [uncultured Chryseobacterium sp.]
MKNTFLKLWGIPILLALLSVFGLVAALNGDGIWDLMGWLSLSVPLFLIIKHYYKNPIR